MKIKRKNISIKRTVIIVFILAMLISIGGIGCLIFTGWFTSAAQTTESISESISRNIYIQVGFFMQTLNHVNEINHRVFEHNILDMSDENQWSKYFASILSSHNEELYGFSFVTANGEYYGARRNGHGFIEIIKNNADTGGNFLYYSFNEDMSAGDPVEQAGPFDPRTLIWYKAAEEAGKPVMSPIYKNLIMDDLTLTSAWPIYDHNGGLRGVLGTHVLLSGIDNYLEDTVKDYHGYAVILETDSGNFIANSMGIDNFTILPNGNVKRVNIAEIENTDIRKAFEYYSENKTPQFVYKGDNDKLFVNSREYHTDGLGWVVISIVPDGFLMGNVIEGIYWTVFLVFAALVISSVIYDIITDRLLNPIDDLLFVSDALSSGDLSKRVTVVRNDEIGSISESLNNVADKMQYLINNLEDRVRQRTEELNKTNQTLEENKNRLQLILNSTAEAIYGIDLNGNCTFCNISCVKMLGYSSQEELLGKNMHTQIHHSRRDGTPFPPEECRILQSVMQARGFNADDEVFWRADGTSFDVEYHSYPQIRNGKVIGAVITFMDITERKQREAEIRYLNCHDALTGLYNRRCLEEKLRETDIPENLPLSVVFADINGLKMTNDIFGHAAGDELIKKSAEILQKSCRKEDIIARVGGDEFILLLPGTSRDDAEAILTRISSGFSNTRIYAIKGSISLGLDIKTDKTRSIEEVMAHAENAMYRDKILNRNAINKEIIDTIVETLHSKSLREKQRSEAVSRLCGKIGSALKLSAHEISKLKRAGYLHNIGKIILDDRLLSKEDLNEEDLLSMQQHSVIGYRILNLFDETLDLAEYVYSHHENWDGSGYPRGLKGEQIPLLSRIISIAECYEHVLNEGDLPLSERKRIAAEAVREGAGKRFDPEIAGTFLNLLNLTEG